MPGSGRDVLTALEDGASPAPAQVARLQRGLLGWYAVSKRDLPWRKSRDPWAIWVSEIMLQQTRVDTVRPYFERFMARFPTPSALAEAAEDEVLAAWSGLGYYRRARMLHAGARLVAGGAMPDRRDALLALPGVGRYTAGAIASIAFEEAVGLVDGNVARVLARLFALEDDMKAAGMRRAERLAEQIVAREDPGSWNQALMELGATVCTPKNPGCERCPVMHACRARAEGRENVLPVLGEKAKPKPERMQVVVARREGKVLLVRRRSSGLFGGLWEPPLATGGPKVLPALQEAFALPETEPRGSLVHVLSHKRLTLDVHAATLPRSWAGPADGPLPEPYETGKLVDEEGLGDLGIATLGRKILAQAGIGPWPSRAAPPKRRAVSGPGRRPKS